MTSENSPYTSRLNRYENSTGNRVKRYEQFTPDTDIVVDIDSVINDRVQRYQNSTDSRVKRYEQFTPNTDIATNRNSVINDRLERYQNSTQDNQDRLKQHIFSLPKRIKQLLSKFFN